MDLNELVALLELAERAHKSTAEALWLKDLRAKVQANVNQPAPKGESAESAAEAQL